MEIETVVEMLRLEEGITILPEDVSKKINQLDRKEGHDGRSRWFCLVTHCTVYCRQ